MPKQSAGLLLYRIRSQHPEVLLVHPGGPFWKNRDVGAWSIPKGEVDSDEDPLVAAQREFNEETGLVATGNFVPLTAVKQRGGKIVHAWLVGCDLDVSKIVSNNFSMEWPPRSGKFADFAEVDRAEWFTLETANEKILESQRPLLAQARSILSRNFH